MTLVFENDLVAPTLTLAIAYLLLSIYACRRLISLHKTAPEMNTRKLFVMTCLLTTTLRLMTFGSMTAFNYAEFHLKVRTDIIPTGDDIIVTDAFFEKATLVLLDVPDWCCISAYVLLIVVCAEALLQSRRHWLSSFEFRRMWILGYLIFNTVLYAVQVLLYSLLFLPSIDQEILTALIYLTLTFFNLGLPVVWMLGFVFLSVRFSGFPFSSLNAKKRLNSLVRLGSIWTVARLGWGFIALTSVMQDWLVLAQKTVPFYSLILISVFFFAEILPIAFSLQNDCLESLTEKSKPSELIIDDVTPNWEEKMISRSGRSHINEYSSISKINGGMYASSNPSPNGLISVGNAQMLEYGQGQTVNSAEGIRAERGGSGGGRVRDDIQHYYQQSGGSKKPFSFPTKPSAAPTSSSSSSSSSQLQSQSYCPDYDPSGDRDHNQSTCLQQDYFSLPCLDNNNSNANSLANSHINISGNPKSRSNYPTDSSKYAEITISNCSTPNIGRGTVKGRGTKRNKGTNTGTEVGNRDMEEEEFDTENGVESLHTPCANTFWGSRRTNKSSERGSAGGNGNNKSINYYSYSQSDGNDHDKSHFGFYSSNSNQQSIDSEMSAVEVPPNNNNNDNSYSNKGSISLRERLGKTIYNSERKWGSWLGF